MDDRNISGAVPPYSSNFYAFARCCNHHNLHAQMSIPISCEPASKWHVSMCSNCNRKNKHRLCGDHLNRLTLVRHSRISISLHAPHLDITVPLRKLFPDRLRVSCLLHISRRSLLLFNLGQAPLKLNHYWNCPSFFILHLTNTNQGTLSLIDNKRALSSCETMHHWHALLRICEVVCAGPANCWVPYFFLDGGKSGGGLRCLASDTSAAKIQRRGVWRVNH